MSKSGAENSIFRHFPLKNPQSPCRFRYFAPDPATTSPVGCPGATTAFRAGGFGNCDTIHSITPIDPNAKITITAMLPHRKDTPCNPDPPCNPFGPRSGCRPLNASLCTSSILNNCATSGVGGSRDWLLGWSLSSMAKKIVAYTAPFVTFMLLTGVCGLLDWAHMLPGGLPAKYLLFPIQTAACAFVLAWYWPQFHLRFPQRKAWLAAAVGLLIFALWISPQVLFHQPPRTDGFDPGTFAGRPWLYRAQLAIRFIRLILVVPALEEIFWRGFLLRFFIDEDFDSIPFGTYAQVANALVAIGFMLEHDWPDYPAALVTGLAYNFVAYRTRSLSSCILAHALTNALLGCYIMATHQWGFW